MHTVVINLPGGRYALGQEQVYQIIRSFEQEVRTAPPLEKGLHEDVVPNTKFVRYNVVVKSNGSSSVSMTARDPTQSHIQSPFKTQGSTQETFSLNTPWACIPCIDQISEGEFTLYGFIMIHP